MHRRSLPLSALRAFGAAARLGSFKAAAEDLAVTPTAISHQIRGLERQTGLTLFDRQVRRIALTEVGRQLYPVLRDGFDAFQASLERLTQARRRPEVVISATHAFTVKWLVPRMADFRSHQPGIDLHLQASDEMVDLRSTAWPTICRPVTCTSPLGRGSTATLTTWLSATNAFHRPARKPSWHGCGHSGSLPSLHDVKL